MLIGIEQQSQKDQNKDDLIIEGDARSLRYFFHLNT